MTEVNKDVPIVPANKDARMVFERTYWDLIKNMVNNADHAEWAIGRLAASLGVTTDEVRPWFAEEWRAFRSFYLLSLRSKADDKVTVGSPESTS